MLRDFSNYIGKEQLFPKGSKLLLAVSGGCDSVVLLDLISKMAEGWEMEFAIVHCNFRLRGELSDRDELFVRELGKKYNCELFCCGFDTSEYAQENGISIEMAARDLRYGFFAKIISENDFDYCAIGHHRDDNAETFFINVLRGTGLKGLRGILPKTDKYVRPLLFASRKEIEEYATKHNLSYVDDHTNFEDIYLRNKLRLNIIPALNGLNQGFSAHLNSAMDLLRGVEGLMNDWCEDVLERVGMYKNDGAKLAGYTGKHKDSDINRSEGFECISLEKLLKEKNFEVFLNIYLRERRFNSAQIEDIINNIKVGESGKIFESRNKEFILYREQGSLRLVGNLDNKEHDLSSGKYGLDGGKYGLNCGNIIVSGCGNIDGSPSLNTTVDFINTEDDIPKNRFVGCFDKEKIKDQLYWRKWETGDFFYPLGLKGKVKLSDFFKNEKIPLSERENIWLLCHNDDIIWVYPYRINDKYKAVVGKECLLIK